MKASKDELSKERLLKMRRELYMATKRSKRRFSFLYGYTFWISGTVTLLVGIVAYVIFFPEISLSQKFVNDEGLIQQVASLSKSFTAAPSKRFEGWTIADVKKMCGHAFLSQNYEQISACIPSGSHSHDIPIEFDARKEWPQCVGNDEVIDPGNCSASWAIAPISALQNRFCIDDPDKNYVPLSYQQSLSCISDQLSCSGGLIDIPYVLASQKGIVSEECFPFQGGEPTSCSEMCSHPTWYKVGSICKTFDEEDTMREILSNGPVATVIPVYTDFLVYSSGVYEPIKTATMLAHQEPRPVAMLQAIKIIGWGVQNKKPYWLIENSWGPEWGDNGFAKIARKVFSSVEYSVVAAAPESFQSSDELHTDMDTSFMEKDDVTEIDMS
ncbi:cathepsin B [Cardiosporidium cionae]|uniref:Cathepsin B n=1 Tax=Cardiosporidium cionae TaxID=476202 RepID=A0ABQ7J7S5_9APIC|nr:cathepsin B [Cardiosporidium cionae]|eukprot:KAF8820044.1 cathepsin B [Cardiosporidium cionae]